MSEVQPLNIQLTPHDALIMCTYFQAMDEALDTIPELKSMQGAVLQFMHQIIINMNEQQHEDAMAENEVNILIGNVPEFPENSI